MLKTLHPGGKANASTHYAASAPSAIAGIPSSKQNGFLHLAWQLSKAISGDQQETYNTRHADNVIMPLAGT